MLDPWRIVFEEYFEPNVVLPLCAGYLKEWCFTYHTRLWFFLTVLCDPFCGLQKGKYFGGQRRKAIDSLVWPLPLGVVTLVTLLEASQFPPSVVLAFEPSPRNII